MTAKKCSPKPDQPSPSPDSLFLEKRKEPRYPTKDLAQVDTFPFRGTPVPATVIDVSKSGLRLELRTPLERGSRVEIMIRASKTAIFGELRYCRQSGAVFHAGVLIEDVVYPSRNTTQHVHEDDLALYIAGKGLTAAEVLRISDHLSACNRCTRVMAQIAATLYRPTRRLPPRDEIAP